MSQMAFCIPLLVAAGLFIRSFQKAASVDLGFDPRGVVQLRSIISNPLSPGRLNETWRSILTKIQSTPGVLSVSVSQPGLFGQSTSRTSVVADGRNRLVYTVAVTPGFFKTLQIRLLRGRTFSDSDQATPLRVAVVNEAFAQRYIHIANPIGEHVMTGLSPEKIEIIGIVNDTKYDNVLGDAPPIIYAPLTAAFIPRFRVFDVRVATAPGAMVTTLQKIVRGVDANLPAGIRPMSDFVGESLISRSLVARAAGFFGVLALLLACIGLYGIVSFFVTQRTHEVGVRIALGAQIRDVVWLIMKEACAVVLCGSAIGIGVSLAVGRLVGAQLFGVTAADPITLVASTGLLWGAAALAAYIPARRAARVDPMVALRHE